MTGNTIETLYDNRPSTEAALSLAAGTSMWSRTLDLDLGRALTAADDDKDLRIRFRYNQVTDRRVVDITVNVGEFRQWTEFDTATGEDGVPVGIQKFPISRGVAGGDNLDSVWNRQGMVFRRGDSAAGNHVLGIVIPAGDGSNYAALSEFRAVVELVPRVDDLDIDVDGTSAAGLISVDEEKFFTTAEISNPAIATNVDRSDAAVPNGGAGTLTQRGTDLGFAAAAATPYNLTYEPEADQPVVVGIMIRGKTGDVDAGLPVFLFFGNAADTGETATDVTFVASDVKVAAGRYIRVRVDMRQGSGDTIDIRTYGGDTPIALGVTLEYFAITRTE